MRSPVQSRVPLLDKNKAFGRLPLLGAFFFYFRIQLLIFSLLMSLLMCFCIITDKDNAKYQK